MKNSNIFNSDLSKGNPVFYKIYTTLYDLIYKSFREKYGFSTYFLFSKYNNYSSEDLPIPSDFITYLSKKDINYLEQTRLYLKHINSNLLKSFNGRISLKKDYTLKIKECLPLEDIKNSNIKEIIIDFLLEMNLKYIKNRIKEVINNKSNEEIKICLTKNFHPQEELFVEILKLKSEFNCDINREDGDNTIIVTINNIKSK